MQDEKVMSKEAEKEELIRQVMELESQKQIPDVSEGVKSEMPYGGTTTTKEVINGTEFDVVEPTVPQYDPGALMTASTSFAEGVMGGWAGEFAGGVAGPVEWLATSEDFSFSDLSAMYKKNRDTYDSVRIKGEEKYPTLALGTEMFGGVGSAMALTGAGVLTNSVKSGAAMGAVSGAGKSEGFDPVAIAGGAALGGATQGIANKLFGTAPSSAAKAAKVTADENNAILNGFNIVPKGEYSITNQAVKASNALSRRGMTLADWAQEIKTTPEGKMVFEVGDNMKTVETKLLKAVEDKGADIGNTLGRLDQLIAQAPDKGVNLVNLTNKIENGLLGPLKDISPSAQKQVVGILKRFSGRETIGFNEAQAVRSEMSGAINFVKNNLNNAENLKHAVNGIFRDEMIASARGVNSELAEKFIADSRSYGNFKLAADLLKEPAISSELTHLGAMQGKMLNAGRRTVVATMLNSKSGTLGAVVEGFKAILGTPPAGLAGKRLASIGKIRTALEAEPGKYQELAAQIMMSASRTHEQFQKTLGYAESVIDLHQSPVQRTTNDLVMKLPQILNVVNEFSPNHGEQLLKAVQSQDEGEIGAIMSELGRLKIAQGLITKGTGWNGKAATAQDLADWEGQIRQSPQNHTIKMRQLEDLRKFGVGPVFQEKTDYVRSTVLSKRNKNGKKHTEL